MAFGTAGLRAAMGVGFAFIKVMTIIQSTQPYAVKRLCVAADEMVTASHNPKEDSGCKPCYLLTQLFQCCTDSSQSTSLYFNGGKSSLVMSLQLCWAGGCCSIGRRLTQTRLLRRECTCWPPPFPPRSSRPLHG
ncbi:uncharacterized protein LOC110507300 isoform X2 [Oncorhynchus mykiss]|uniref:uncharacterized protein LOC110507300 isoform X2 n=1 Tax=Oncorhynchus mykiss TaxID=8022 RepID=UPI0018787313|nr:uncharacterized protein LOC110507300 isoform X2 [Oncorhynchus mykiss]